MKAVVSQEAAPTRPGVTQASAHGLVVVGSAGELVASPDEETLGASRVGRFAVVTLFILGYVSVGLILNLPPVAYLLLGVPLTAVFQLVIARRPIQALWLTDGRPFRLDRLGAMIALGLTAVPAYLLVLSLSVGDGWNAVYELVTILGVAPAAYALRAIDSTARRALVRAILTAGLVGGGFFVLSALAARGIHTFDDAGGMFRAAAISFLQYIPTVFVIEEVLFRGALDPFARGGRPERDRASALLVSTLWGAWHLPVTFAASGLGALPVLVVFHGLLGLFLTGPWRRSGNLAVPGLTHALIDAIRNAFVAL